MPDSATDGQAGTADVTDRELRVCTVRIDIAGQPKGSGFFVAPGHVVTCSHVLESLDLTAPEAIAAIGVSDVEGVPYAVEAVPTNEPAEDLAVLRVAPSYNHRCVLLIPGLRMFDRFVTFGYPERRREGVARPLTSEGTTGDERLQSFGEGQVEPGMSGAPVLNRRTGGVCGVLSLTRNELQALGGYAIPIERLSLISPTIARQNAAHHQAARYWFDLLSAEQKGVLLDSGPGIAVDDGFGLLFVVSVGGDEHDWEVRATLYPGGPLTPEEVDLNAVRDKVARLFRDWASRSRTNPTEVALGRFDPGEEARLLGGILFSAVLPGAIGRRFGDLLPTGGERIQLALHFRAGISPAIVELPWERLYLSRPGVMTDIHLSRADKIAFVRVLKPEPEEREPPHRGHLSALMIGVNPPDVAGEPAADAVLNAAPNLGGLEFKTLPMPRAADVHAEVAAGFFDIVHYVGFGQYVSGADKLAVLDRGGGHQYLDAEMFAAQLADRRPRMVVLQQVEGPKDIVPADLSAFAWKLLELGVEAVVAYQFPLPPALSIAFNETFYEALTAGNSFEMAAQKARIAIWMEGQELHAFFSPAAFAVRPGELKLTAAAADMAPLPRVGVIAGHA
jgi:hypothetical protein